MAVVNRLDCGCPFMPAHEPVPSKISGYMLDWQFLFYFRKMVSRDIRPGARWRFGIDDWGVRMHKGLIGVPWLCSLTYTRV